jgi:hypothetical protein
MGVEYECCLGKFGLGKANTVITGESVNDQLFCVPTRPALGHDVEIGAPPLLTAGVAARQ